MKSSVFVSIIGCVLGVLLIPACTTDQATTEYHAIRFIDGETGRGVPLVAITSLNKASYISDSQGYIAYYEPGLMGDTVYFEIEVEGYWHPRDETGRQAVSIYTTPGEVTTVSLVRLNAAERLYRTTGHGIYKDSYLLGKSEGLPHPLLNARVLGQDSNLGAIYNGKVFWIWGDTFLPSRYHGNFSVSGAVSDLPTEAGKPIEQGIQYSYFTNQYGASKPMIELDGPGYTWFEWLLPMKDADGEEVLAAKYARVGGHWQNYERGIAVFNDESETFERFSASEDWLDGYAIMHHPFKARTDGVDHFYMTSEFEMQRVVASLDSVGVPSAYETFTCLRPGEEFAITADALVRDADGKLVYRWVRDGQAMTSARIEQFIQAGLMRPEEAWIQLIDVHKGHRIPVSRGSVYWNDYRKRWILIADGSGDYAGDVIYAEADTPVGPWGYATVVAMHDNMFYNPSQHPFFDQEDGRIIYFEGTYTNFWDSGSTKAYYDYNQLMYKLDLGQDESRLPSPVYRMSDNDLLFGPDVSRQKRWSEVEQVAFYAFEPTHRPVKALPVYKDLRDGDVTLSTDGSGEPFMYAYPVEPSPLSEYAFRRMGNSDQRT